MSPPPPPPRRHLLTLLALVALFPPLLLASSSFPLPTIAIAAVSGTNATTTNSTHNLACALVPSGNGTTDYQISCASVSNRSAEPLNYSYGGGITPYSAVVAGDGYLCSAGPTVSPPMALRWWDLEDSKESSSKRVYWGKALSAVSGGGEYVCGLADERIQCWRWSRTFNESLRFSAVAVGGGFVCGLAKGSGEVKCLGDRKSVSRRVPKGSHAMLAAGERHACAVKSVSGEVVCWGEAAAVASASPPSSSVAVRSVSSLAVGDAITCVLWGNWTVACWPAEEAAPPSSVAQQQFVALEARGKVVCGVLMSDYSLVCWGSGAGVSAGGGVSRVFDRVLPGPCAPWTSCTCGVWSGSAPLCGGAGDASVCYPCGYTPQLTMVSTTPSPTSNSPASSETRWKHRRPSDLAIASAGIGSGVLVAIAAVVAVYCGLRRRRRRRRRSGAGAGVSQGPGRIHAEPTGPPPRVERRLSALLSKGPNTTVEQFPLAALRAATDGFSPSHRIGSGSFGVVYRATLPDGRDVAIKRAERRRSRDPPTAGAASSSSSFVAAAARRANCNDDEHEVAFVSELSLLSRVNHKNLVRLLGFCADGGERILVYEYMPNGTLHDHLHRRPPAAPLSPPLASWPARLRLALGAARGVEYMHTYAVPPIIHRDIKSPNILLDASWTAKVSDFGLSLLIHDDHHLTGGDEPYNAAAVADGEGETCVTAGTVGYMDPEYYRLQHLTEKSDVYSFGVVLLELLSGCKAIQRFEGGSGTPKNVVDVTVPHIEADRVHRVLDARLPLPTPAEMEAVAYVGYLASDCVRPAGRDRPTMSEVVGVLERAVAACEEQDDGGAGGGEAVLSRSCTDGSTT